MTFTEIHEAARSGKAPAEIKEGKAPAYQLLAYYQLKEFEVVKHKKLRSDAELEARLKQIRIDYAVNMGQHDRGTAAIKQRSEFMHKIESAASAYGVKRTRSTADTLLNAIYNLEDYWRDTDGEFKSE